MSTSRASIRRAVFSLVFITLAYVTLLVVIDLKKDIFDELVTFAAILPAAMIISLLSYLVRYIRWHRLLSRAGHNTPTGIGLLAYLSGFALTATPGKIGELLRIRYYARLGVRHQRIISAFIYERAFDLIAVLMIASLAAFQLGAYLFISSFVLCVLTVVILFAKNPSWLGFVSMKLRTYHFRKLSRMVKALRDGLHGIHIWINPADISMSLVTGLTAWLLTSCVFVWLLVNLGLEIPILYAVAIYPISMLVGAASMLPGGVGTTEATIVALLVALETPVTIATVAAIGIRIASLWFSIVCGLIAMAILEYRHIQNPPK